LSGHRPVKRTDEKEWDAWEEYYYPEEYQYTATGEKFPLQYTEEELNAMCDKAASDEEKEKCQEYNIREEEYYNKKTELDAEIEEIRKEGGYDWTPPVSEQKSDHYYNYTRNDINRKNPFETQNGVTYTEYTKAKIEVNSAWNDGWTKQHYQEIVDKYEGKQPKKWVLPVEQFAGSEEYLISFPDDLLKAANLKEGDEVEWVDQGDGSYLLKKVVKPMTHDEMIAAGYTMTADGFWIKE